MSLSGLELSGVLSVIQNATEDVGTSMVENLALQEVTTDRPTATSTATAAYYIKVVADINAAISFHGSESGSNLDDAWSMTALSFNSNVHSASLKLPTASNVDVPAGLITASYDGGSGTFPVTLSVSASDEGVLSSTIAISGSSIEGQKNDDYAKAQKAYWPINNGTYNYSQTGPTALGATDSDLLTASLEAADLSTNYTSTLDTINAKYNTKNMISSWSLSVSAVDQATNSNLSNHARVNNITNATVFAGGDMIVAATPASYAVSINDYESNATQIVAATNVYGVVQQSESSP